MWTSLSFLLGLKVESVQEFEDYTVDLTAYVLEEYPDRTIEEIILAYKMAVKGRLGVQAYRELNPNSFGSLMRAYDENTASDYQAALDQMDVDEKEPDREPTSEELEAIYRDRLTEAFRAAREGEVYHDYGAYLYDELDRHGHLGFTPEQKREFVEIAGRELTAEKKKEAETSFGIKRMNIQKSIEDLHSGSDTSKQLLIIRAKRICLNKYLKDCIEFDVKPEDLFNL